MLGRAGRGGQGAKRQTGWRGEFARVAAVERSPEEAPLGATAQPALLGQHASSSCSGDRPSAPVSLPL